MGLSSRNRARFLSVNTLIGQVSMDCSIGELKIIQQVVVVLVVVELEVILVQQVQLLL